MLRKSVASLLSNPFRGDRPIWLTLIGTLPCMGVLALYEYMTSPYMPAWVPDSFAALISAGLLLSMAIVATAAAAAWGYKQAVRLRANVTPDTLDDVAPEAEYGVAA